MLNKLLIAVLFLFTSFIHAQENDTQTLSGFIYDNDNGETMIGANIYVKELGTGTASNVYGFYSITLPRGEYSIEVSFVGYEKSTKKIKEYSVYDWKGKDKVCPFTPPEEIQAKV